MLAKQEGRASLLSICSQSSSSPAAAASSATGLCQKSWEELFQGRDRNPGCKWPPCSVYQQQCHAPRWKDQITRPRSLVSSVQISASHYWCPKSFHPPCALASNFCRTSWNQGPFSLFKFFFLNFYNLFSRARCNLSSL